MAISNQDLPGPAHQTARQADDGGGEGETECQLTEVFPFRLFNDGFFNSPVAGASAGNAGLARAKARLRRKLPDGKQPRRPYEGAGDPRSLPHHAEHVHSAKCVEKRTRLNVWLDGRK